MLTQRGYMKYWKGNITSTVTVSQILFQNVAAMELYSKSLNNSQES